MIGLLRRGSFALVVAASGLLHAGAYLASESWIDGGAEHARPAMALVELVDVPARASTPVEPETPPPEVVEPEPEPAPRRRPRPARASAPDPSPPARGEPDPPADPAPAPADPAPPVFADLTGVTLEGAGGSWAAPSGNGASRDGPAVSRPRRGGSVRAPAPPSPPARGPRVVVPSDLSRIPEPPAGLADALEANFPPHARARGQSGRATLRARIHPDGSVGMLALVSATRPEFGEACRRTLRGSRWTPPLDDRGRPVATDVRYVCRFEVD